MVETNATTYGAALPLDGFGGASPLHLPTRGRDAAPPKQQSELAIDDTLAASFPASDPPGWNPGLAGTGSIDTVPEPAAHARPMAARDPGAGYWDVIEVSRPYDSERTAFQTLTSMVGAVAVALVVPFAILLVGLPVALGGRGLLEALQWLGIAIH